MFSKIKRKIARYLINRLSEKEAASKLNEKADQAPVQKEVIFSDKLLDGKNVLITGAGQNIGRSIALEMAKQGANIYFTDIRSDRCRKLESELSLIGCEFKGLALDCSSIQDLDSLVETLKQASIHVDILVNNLGITPEIKEFKDIQIDEWQKVLNTNLLGPCHLTRLIIRNMVEKCIHGSVIFVTSIHQDTIFGASNYSSSKAAIAMLVKELALECARNSIRVNGIAPGWVAEDENKNPFNHPSTPLYKTSVTPDYIGRGAVFLASDYFSRYTTGTIFKIDGGLSLHTYLTRT